MTATEAPVTAFDGSKTPPGDLPAGDDATTREAHGLTGFNALDAIGAQIAERDAEEQTTCTVEVPGLDLRLVCSTVVPYEEYQKWQLAALPAKERKSRRPKVVLSSQLVLSCMVLVGTCEGIEHKVNGEWQPMKDSKGEVFTLESDELLRRFNVIDINLFLRKLFGRDPRLLAAAEKVIIASEWLEDEDDLDPTA